jgi:hypothetical protein
MKTYEEALRILGDKQSITLPGAVTLERDDDALRLFLDGAPLVVYHSPDWSEVFAPVKNKKTMNRLNTYSPWEIENLGGVWRLRRGLWEGLWISPDPVSIRDGVVAGLRPTFLLGTVQNERESAKRYARTLVKRTRLRGLRPRAGEEVCAQCEIMIGDQTLGEISKDRNHFMTHIAYAASVPAIVARAVEVAPKPLHDRAMYVLRKAWREREYLPPDDWRPVVTAVRCFLFSRLGYAA